MRLDRADFAVLVPEAAALGQVGVIRSLGRAGYPVHACGNRGQALGLHSRYAVRAALHPAYGDPGFLPWLRGYIADHGIAAIIPSEGFLLAIRRVFAEFAPLLPVSPDPTIVYPAMCKFDFFEKLLASDNPLLRDNLPPTILITRQGPPLTADMLRNIAGPYFLKVDGLYANSAASGQVVKVRTAAEAVTAAQNLLRDYDRLVVQGYVPGVKPGAFLILWNGQTIARYANISSHQMPHTSGMGTLRRNFRHDRLMQSARAALDLMNWQGVAMVEYRWDPESDRFWFIELNARFWGSLHHALYAGVDFPLMLVDAFRGVPVPPVLEASKDVTCRYIPGDFVYLFSRLKDGDVSFAAKVATTLEFVWLFCHPGIKSDLWFPGDRGLYWRGLWGYFRGLVRG